MIGVIGFTHGQPASQVVAAWLIGQVGTGILAHVIGRYWPEQISGSDIQSPSLIRDVEAARLSLLDTLGLAGLASR